MKNVMNDLTSQWKSPQRMASFALNSQVCGNLPLYFTEEKHSYIQNCISNDLHAHLECGRLWF
jgi:hypothetical protein